MCRTKQIHVVQLTTLLVKYHKRKDNVIANFLLDLQKTVNFY